MLTRTMRNSLDIAKPAAATRVVVAMSGGVDSSVVAALLKQEGYDVVGVTLQLYDHGEATHRRGACCAGQDVFDARRVAEMLDIPHYVLDYEERFRRDVIEDFAAAYAAGETPIPCVACNRTVKFRDLLATAAELGADVLATGHYVASREVDGRRALFRPADDSRDQSYFLFATTPEQLDKVRFPLGEMTKAETRDIARRAGLVVAEKADSQDICFVPTGRYSEVIQRLRPGAAEPGEIIHVDGRVLGRHPGIIHFTVGQRKGLGVAAGEPIYVVALDAARRRVVVGPRSALAARRLVLRDLNWLGEGTVEDAARAGRELYARVRSSRAPSRAELVLDDGEVGVVLLDGEDGVSPGQACVFYDAPGGRSRVLGGGFIRRAIGTANSAGRAEPAMV
jgi:tRNA-specific 2-thiouridylase